MNNNPYVKMFLTAILFGALSAILYYVFDGNRLKSIVFLFGLYIVYEFYQSFKEKKQ